MVGVELGAVVGCEGGARDGGYGGWSTTPVAKEMGLSKRESCCDEGLFASAGVCYGQGRAEVVDESRKERTTWGRSGDGG